MLSGRGENSACAVPTPIFQLNVRLSTARPHYETLVTLTFLMLHASRRAQPIHEAENTKAVGRTRCDAEVQAISPSNKRGYLFIIIVNNNSILVYWSNDPVVPPVYWSNDPVVPPVSVGLRWYTSDGVSLHHLHHVAKTRRRYQRLELTGLCTDRRSSLLL